MKRPDRSRLFARWFWFVYLPIGLFVALVLLKASGLLPPGGITVVMVLLGLYSALGIRLLIERRRMGIEVPAPANIVAGIAVVSALVLVGGILFTVGWNRLGKGEGLVLLGLGSFLMIASVTVPIFKLMDSAVRRGKRLVARGKGTKKRVPAATADEPALTSSAGIRERS